MTRSTSSEPARVIGKIECYSKIIEHRGLKIAHFFRVFKLGGDLTCPIVHCNALESVLRRITGMTLSWEGREKLGKQSSPNLPFTENYLH